VRSGLGPTLTIALLVVGHSARPSCVLGQSTRLELDLTASRLDYDSLSPLNAPSVSALAEWQGPSLYGRLSSGLVAFQGAGWSVQGRGTLSGWLTPFGDASPIRLELGGSAGGSHHSSGFNTGSAGADARLHALGRRIGGWVGVGMAGAENSYDSVAVRGYTPSLGMWLQDGNLRGTASYQHLVVDGEAYPEASAALTLTRWRLDLTAYGGVRGWPGDAPGIDEGWAGATAAFWLSNRAALVVSGGGYPADVLQRLPGGRFLSFAVRLTPRRVRPVPVTATAPIVFTVEQAGAGAIGFDVSGATRVEIAGDWTGWQTVPLERGDRGRWMLPTHLEPGAYRFNLLIDGERWLVPDGVPTIDDGFGGVVGLLIVAKPGEGL
jgi:hypothetical protein